MAKKPRKPTGHGGWRPGAGRPRGRKHVAHEKREPFTRRDALHVSLRVAPGVPPLRKEATVAIVRTAIEAAHAHDDIRIVHFKVLDGHLHFLVETDDPAVVPRRLQGLTVALARRLNAHLGRTGKLFAERYHARVLRTPDDARAALRDILLGATHRIDPYSSGPWFDGWKHALPVDQPGLRKLLQRDAPTAPPRTRLLREGWTRAGGPLAFDELAAAAPK
jgi:REP element-mobilizing transposase RayT